MSAYLHPAYAASLSRFGSPRPLHHCGGWILERQIANSAYFDAMGCYPIFACRDWSQLHKDLNEIGNALVSLALVTDPFGEFDAAYLKRCFPDVTRAFKEHFVVDLSLPPDRFVNAHHRRNARKALRELRVEQCVKPLDLLDDWVRLYGHLIQRHQIKGIAAFSPESFAQQLQVPGMVMLRAVHNDVTVGVLLWYAEDKRAYYHLGAYSDRGYELGASFALFDYSLGFFAEGGFQWLSLGGGAGVGNSREMGLSRFKQGWATGTRTAWFCGRILDAQRYRELSDARGTAPGDYFPAYRFGEYS